MNKQQIKARFFGAHIGCDVNISLYGYSLVYATNCGVVTGARDSVLISVGELSKYSDEEFGIKLVLRPLSSITDAEAVDLFTMATGLYIAGIDRRDDKIVGVGMGKGSGNIINGGGNVAMWTKISPLPVGRLLETWSSQAADAPECAEHRAIDYLRSINICVPFMGLDPIAEGWAILEEKIPAKRTIAIKCTKTECRSSGVVSSDDCEIPKTAASAIETCPRHKKDGDIGSDLKFFDSAGNIVY